MAKNVTFLDPIVVADHLLRHADLMGNANGKTTTQEVIHSLRTRSGAQPRRPRGRDLQDDILIPPEVATKAESIAYKKAMAAHNFETLDPQLRTLPPALRRLALEIDALWGNADGVVSTDEFQRVSRYYLAALPFFTSEARLMLELAEYLGFVGNEPLNLSATALELKAALDSIDVNCERNAKPFKDLFVEAVGRFDFPGAPERLRGICGHDSKWHALSILEHTAVAVYAVNQLCKSSTFARVKKPLKLSPDALSATLLLHDVGKIVTRKQVLIDGDPNHRRYAFWMHEQLGATWLKDRVQCDMDMEFHVDHHSDIRKFSSGEEIWDKLVRHDKKRLAEMVLIYFADQIAKGATPDQLASFAAEQPKLREMCTLAGLDAEELFEVRRAVVKKWFEISVA